MELNLNYTHSEKIGYGRLGVKLHKWLERAGVDVFDYLPPPEGVATDSFGGKDLRAGVATHACWVSYPSHAPGWWSGQRLSTFTMWEATRLPEAFRETLHEFETIVVPSQQNVALFSEWHPNVQYVPLGVDPEEWFYVPRREPGAVFNFLIGGTGPRKGVDVAFDAFVKAFPTHNGTGPEPRLVMKNPVGERYEFGNRVTVIAGKLPPEDERSLYESAHCYVQPARGEGFGLQPLQAIAQGLPTILTDAHGHESFAHLGYGVRASEQEAGYFMLGDAGDWWEPDLDEVVDRMRWVYDHYDEATTFAAQSAQVVANEWTWAHTVDKFTDAIGLPSTREFLRDKGTWVKPEPRLYRIRLTRDYRCDIAGRRMFFEAGKDYWELADVKRILVDAGGGLVDPVCVDEVDSGLSPEQVTQHGKNRPKRWHLEGEDPAEDDSAWRVLT